MNIVKANMPDGSVKDFDLEIANPSCRSCHGTGKIGFELKREGARVIKRTPLLCTCVMKNTIKKEKEEKESKT